MSKGLELQLKLRRSDVLTEEDIYKDFMKYARQVSDELEVYIYMEQNEIGINTADYWLARFQVLQNRCQFISLVQLISKAKKLPGVEAWQLEHYQVKLKNHLERIIYEPYRGKRKAAMHNLRQIPHLHPQKRKIGNIEVFVDEKCRYNYYLQDFAKYVQTEMKDYCQVEKAFYKRQQTHKPPSFLAKNQQHLMELAEQLLSKNGRRSLNRRSSMNPVRFSNQVNNYPKEQTLKDESFCTPKNNILTTSNDPKTAKPTADKVKCSKSRDSVEILKQLRDRHVLQKKSPRFADNVELNQFVKQVDDNNNKSENIITECCRSQKECNDDWGFSFGKNRKTFSLKEERNRNQPQVQINDNAFLFQSFSQGSKSLENINSNVVKREDFQLQLLIKQIQKETYEKLESHTFSSQIDSNQQNKDYLSNKIQHLHPNQQNRKAFQILFQTDENKNKQRHSYNLQELMQIDDDERNPQYFQGPNFSLHMKSQRKQKPSQKLQFHSEQKRLSNIVEECSFYTQSKKKNHQNF